MNFIITDKKICFPSFRAIDIILKINLVLVLTKHVIDGALLVLPLLLLRWLTVTKKSCSFTGIVSFLGFVPI